MRPRTARARRRKPRFTAATADRHTLYQLAVQSPVEDVRFLARVYRNVRGRNPLHLREDFCGTALLCAAWVRRGPLCSAEGFDICRDTLEWGREHNFPPLGARARRIELYAQDVRKKSRRRPDLRCAQNFSYFVFKERRELLGYFRSARRDLAPRGVFVLDIYGGPDATEEEEEVRKLDEGFTYVWDQRRYVPATGDYQAYIHFRFPDGSELPRAFRYDWRLWTLPEVKDVLHEAGFRHVDSYWEGTDADGESGNGVFRRSERGENCAAWVTYLVAYD
jgi:SAM-dependent methyltransferase